MPTSPCASPQPKPRLNSVGGVRAPESSRARRELLADIAEMYYLQERTQNDIAAALGVSRVGVYRLLREARESGVVEVRIHRTWERLPQLEAELCRQFGLERALVTAAPGPDAAALLRAIGETGAGFIEGRLSAGMTLAVCLGRTTYAVIRAFQPRPGAHIRIVQAMGSIPFSDPAVDSGALARQLAAALGGEALHLPSPLFADSREAAQVLRRQPDIARALAGARAADLALLGIGNLDPERSALLRAIRLPADQLSELAVAGAVGDVAGHLIREDGSLCCGELGDRIIGLSLAELRAIPLVVAAAYGLDKAAAIRGALRTGVLNVLCTDEPTARALLPPDSRPAASGPQRVFMSADPAPAAPESRDQQPSSHSFK